MKNKTWKQGWKEIYFTKWDFQETLYVAKTCICSKSYMILSTCRLSSEFNSLSLFKWEEEIRTPTQSDTHKDTHTSKQTNTHTQSFPLDPNSLFLRSNNTHLTLLSNLELGHLLLVNVDLNAEVISQIWYTLISH